MSESKMEMWVSRRGRLENNWVRLASRKGMLGCSWGWWGSKREK